MKDEFGVSRVRPRGLIRYLGLLLGFVAGAPSAIGCLYFLFNFPEIAANPGGAAFCFVLGPLITFATYRWITIGGEASEQLISLRGWWGSSTVSPDQLAEIRKIEYTTTSHVNGVSRTNRTWYYGLFDHDGQQIGHVPSMLMACANWDMFLQHMQQLAADSRKRRGKKSSDKPQSLADKPVDEWTAEDLERYEREN